MRPERGSLVAPLLAGFVAAFLSLVSLVAWVERPGGGEGVTLRLPGADAVPPGARNRAAVVAIGRDFRRFGEAPVRTEDGGSWPRFRGPRSDAIVDDGVALLERFPPEGPPVLWRVPLGEGHAAPAIHRGRVYVMDHLEEEKAEALRCFDLRDGRELWRRGHVLAMKRNHGFSRTVPAVDDERVVAIGPLGHVMALDAESGDLLWGLDLVGEHGAEIPQWYTGQCPFMEKGRVLVAPAGPKTLLMALDGATGRPLWSTANPGGLTMSHSSIMPATMGGRPIYLYAARGGVVAVEAEGEAAGRIVWLCRDWGPSVLAPSPVPLGDDRLFLCAGYGAGGALLQVEGGASGPVARVVQTVLPKEGFALEQQTAVFHEGLLFGILPKDAGAGRARLVAADPTDLRRILARTDERFGLGPFMVVGDRFLVLADDGTLHVLAFRGDRFETLAAHAVLEGPDAWGPMAFARGRLILRDATSMVCLDLSRDGRWSAKGGRE